MLEVIKEEANTVKTCVCDNFFKNRKYNLSKIPYLGTECICEHFKQHNILFKNFLKFIVILSTLRTDKSHKADVVQNA